MAEPRFDLAASSLRADLSDARSLAAALAAKLEDTLPSQTTVQRRGSRLLSRERRVEQVEVQLGPDTFVLSLSGRGPQATRAKTVGGIVIRRQELPLDTWLQALGEALAAEAERSEAARAALERLLDE
jgi:hypothetical protein